MTSFDYDIAVLGGGAAGLTTAAGCAQTGAKTLVIEKEEHLGGDCLHYGCVPSKTLIRSANICHLMHHSSVFGLPKVDIPPVEFHLIARRIQKVIETIQEHDSPERFCKLGAAVKTGKATFVDDHQISLEDGSRITAEKWVIATGSHSSIPAIPGLDTVPYLTNRDIFTLQKLPQSMIILGGGPIAVEMAQAFARLGSKVTIIQRSGQILSREDPDLANILQEHLENEDVAVRTQAVITRIFEDKDAIREQSQNAEGKLMLFEAEKLLVALGRSPNIADLNLEKAGVDFTAQGIVVDQRLRTSQKHIYAAGDVTGNHLFTHAAGYEGGIVVSNAAFHLPRKVDYTLMPWCTYTDPELASVGYNEKSAESEGINYKTVLSPLSEIDRAQAEGETEGLIKILIDRKERIIGTQIAGLHAGDLIQSSLYAIQNGYKLMDLMGPMIPYPTLGEIQKRAAGNYLAAKLFNPGTKKILKKLYRYRG
jgi:pyruvate/2-oxoglutarate dehydrogenase complex dihydrolipoamide dehydrogenase (E3) component